MSKSNFIFIFQTYSGKQTEELNVSNNGTSETTPAAEDGSALKKAAKEAIASSGAEVNNRDFSIFTREPWLRAGLTIRFLLLCQKTFIPIYP